MAVLILLPLPHLIVFRYVRTDRVRIEHGKKRQGCYLDASFDSPQSEELQEHALARRFDMVVIGRELNGGRGRGEGRDKSKFHGAEHGCLELREIKNENCAGEVCDTERRHLGLR